MTEVNSFEDLNNLLCIQQHQNCMAKTCSRSRGRFDFYSIFDKLYTSPEQRPLPAGTALSPPFTVQEAEVRSLFGRQSTRKASGIDNISTSTLGNCADQHSNVFTDIYNSSLHQCRVPVCFKASTIIHIPKKSKIFRMSDYCPVALTSVAMKVFERIVLKYLKTATNGLLYPHQFVYQANRSVDDAVALDLNNILKHLDAQEPMPGCCSWTAA